MASLPSTVIGTKFTLDPDFKRHTPTSLSFDKKIHGNGVQLEKAFDPINLELNESISAAIDGNARVETTAYIQLLQECVERSSFSAVERVHSHIIKTGTHQDVFLMTFLVNVYGKCGRMDYARKVFDTMPKRNVVSWTSLMSGYVHNLQPEAAISVFLHMLGVGGFPSNFTLGIAVNACTALGEVEFGKQVHGFVLKYNVGYDTSVGNALCSLYSKNGGLEYAIEAFRCIEEKNVISWTSIISACGDNGDPMKGLHLFVEMLDEGEVEPNEFTLTSVLSLCCLLQALKAGVQVHSFCIKNGFESNLPVMNSVMYLYLKSGWIKQAKQLFDGMENISLVTWNSMIAGHAQMMDSKGEGFSAVHSGVQALELFLKMQRSGMKPDLFTYSSVFSVCSSLVALEQGEQIHAQTIKSGFLSDVIVGTALVDMYSKCGSIDRASKAFLEMSIRTMISWTSMITALARHGQSQQALQFFEDMRFVGVKPNKITFVGVLAACSHAGMVDEGMAYFKMMKNVYKLHPVMDHYACLIDMFVRLGRLEEAFDLVRTMEFEPNEVIWNILIAGSRSHGKLELAFHAAEKLLNLNPDSETYFSILNLYIQAERWQDVSRVRKLIKTGKVGNLKDWSWISIKDKVHSFKPDDQVKSVSPDVEDLLKNLEKQARSQGYEMQTGSEVINSEEEEEKAASSSVHHSEKLAVAFGLLNTPNSATITVNKSIKMCRDCHNFVKFVSVSTGRTIIIRDSKKLHKFVEGRCSCGDFISL